jgi:3-oxoacyl-[acyl-carrier protein] reductase
MELKQVQAIVTGAASGLGYHYALELARAGAGVVAGDVDEAGLRRLEAEADSLPGSVVAIPLDVAEEGSVRAFVDDAFRRVPGINTLVNNAGVLLDGVLLRPEDEWMRKLTTAQWKRVLDVNLTGTFLMTREVAAAMLQAGARGGLVVNTSSLARGGNAGQSAYASSKAGVDASTRSWAVELAPYGIRVVGIAPGVVETPMLDNISPEALDGLRGRTLVGRFGRPEEIWLALRFAIECEFFSGRVLEVDGGSRM